jgi:CheY-like chemotaxis protein
VSVVLVADDEPAVLDALSQVVEDLGHRVVRAHDGREALQLARAHKPQLVITDHMMPRLSGLDLLRQLGADEQLKAVPVLLLSAAPPSGVGVETKAFLPKPFELSDFEQLVEKLLAEAGASDAPAPATREPPKSAEDRLAWVLQHASTPIAQLRGRIDALQVGTGVSQEELRKQLDEMGKALGELERVLQKAGGSH